MSVGRSTCLLAIVLGGLLVGHAQTAPMSSFRTVRLVASPIRWELAPGRRVVAWAYNGQVPGPILRVRAGEGVRIVVENRLPEATAVHWHGVDVPFPMDGVPGVTQAAIAPGGRFVYAFPAHPAGTRWYHTHADEVGQLDRGLHGPFVVDPQGERSADREYVLVLGSWVTGQGRPVRPSLPDGMMQGMRERMGIAGPPYDTFTVNGKAFPATPPLRVRRGERVRLRILNASGHAHFTLRLDGHRMRVTHTDGNPLQEPVEVDVLPMAPAERYDVEVVADRPGTWALHDTTPEVAAAGLRVQVVYEGYERAPPSPDPRPESSLRRWTYRLGRGVNTIPRPTSGRVLRYDLVLGWGMMMAPDRWTINGRAYPDTAPLRVRFGDLVRLRISNMSPDSHPIHLHGHSFRVLSWNGTAFPAPLIKDTVDVPSMGEVELEFVARNPGRWLMHCHKVLHMHGGMATLVVYE